MEDRPRGHWEVDKHRFWLDQCNSFHVWDM